MSDRDIVERLRKMADRATRHHYGLVSYWNAVAEAADEIERLSARVEWPEEPTGER